VAGFVAPTWRRPGRLRPRRRTGPSPRRLLRVPPP
jgi:hypothetical protein